MPPIQEDFEQLLELNKRLRRIVMPWVYVVAAAMVAGALTGFLPGHWAIWLLAAGALMWGAGVGLEAYGGTKLRDIVRRREARERS